MNTDGEIPLIDADRLDDVEVVSENEDFQFDLGTPEDNRAVKRLADRLKESPAGKKAGGDKIFETAVDIYAKNCQLISSGRATDEQIRKAADLFGESPEALKARLIEEKLPPDDGEGELLKKLFSD